MDVAIELASEDGPRRHALEIVERKGIGHPDTMCDALAEELCRALCRYYQDRFGQILHHNVDKALLRAGRSAPAFGGGEVIERMEFMLAGRATDRVGSEPIPVESLAVDSAQRWLSAHLHALHPDHHVRIRALTRAGSMELTGLLGRGREAGSVLANDTSCGVGTAPRTELENIVLLVERRLSSAAAREAHPEIGEDIKVMGVKHAGKIELTIACAFVGAHLSGLDAYLQAKGEVARLASDVAQRSTEMPVTVTVNGADDPARGEIYLTVTGTSAECGDDGQVGRGNRLDGLITPCRGMSLEAVAGKNPVSHVGKLYNVAAHRMAEALVRELPEVAAATCYLVSRIGRPIADPHVVDVRLSVPGRPPSGLREAADAIVRHHVAAIPELWREALERPLYLL